MNLHSLVMCMPRVPISGKALSALKRNLPAPVKGDRQR